VKHTRTEARVAAGWLLAAAMLNAGCADEGVNPVPSEPTNVVEPPDAGEGGAPPSGPRVREVYVRNPFGSPVDNLLADGDFELSFSTGSGQFGWMAFKPSFADQELFSETGGTCKSGLRCARLPKKTTLLGRGTSAAGEAPNRASIWLKPAEPLPEDEDKPCDLADAWVVDGISFGFVKKLQAADLPDDSGWCEFKAEAKGSRSPYWMYIELGDYEVLVDHAVLIPAPDLEGQPLPPLSPVPKEQSERAQRVREIIRNRTPIGAPPPAPPGSFSRE
jgi:hypothetical protein